MLRDTGAIDYRRAVIKVLDRAKSRVLGIFRGLPGGGGRLVPIDKKQLGRELAIAPDRASGAVDGDLVAVVGVNFQDFPDDTRAFVHRLGVTFPALVEDWARPSTVARGCPLSRDSPVNVTAKIPAAKRTTITTHPQ